MRAFILALKGASLSIILKDEQLENFRRLLDMGWYGEFVYETALIENREKLTESEIKSLLRREVNKSGKVSCWIESERSDVQEKAPHLLSIDYSIEALLKIRDQSFQRARQSLTNIPWDLCWMEDEGLRYLEGEQERAGYLLSLDAQLPGIFELLDDNSLVAILFYQASQLESFLLVIPRIASMGELNQVAVEDLTATILHALGCIASSSDMGRSLLAGIDLAEKGDGELTEEEQNILRERLSGLGYL